MAEGQAFSPDTPWQHEFEAAFRFEETADQLRAIEEVKKRHGAHSVPWTGLVAGDVGFGKTEVALRAAFKAVADGYQVAVLVPTTVLAQQHWNTFTERFGGVPGARRAALALPLAEGAEVRGRGAPAGHGGRGRWDASPLSKDVAFKNLGLLIVDEEHRFGVANKERMKQLRASVDVLAMTATPIPRTLYMSLSGVRDMSVIETAPLERLPVETYVRRFGKPVVKEAIERELARGGQVFFVHNRSPVAALRGASHPGPGARRARRHGPRPDEASASWRRPWCGSSPARPTCSVSTAIVESGLDIPASNTIIVNRADRFGLAQLYQLRGRVGRERQQAYAYLLVPADGRVDEQAQRRLRVLQELTELGSGFKLALRDLEIRGAGNLLGPSSTATSPPSATIFTRSFSARPCENCAVNRRPPPSSPSSASPCRGSPARGLRAGGQPTPALLQALAAAENESRPWPSSARNWPTASDRCPRSPSSCSIRCVFAWRPARSPSKRSRSERERR